MTHAGTQAWGRGRTGAPARLSSGRAGYLEKKGCEAAAQRPCLAQLPSSLAGQRV